MSKASRESNLGRASGGKTIYGASVGILMLESRFPRIPGDGGNARTWPFPLLYRVVENATPERVVRGGAQGLVDRFLEAGRYLVSLGVDGITTNCGFMVMHQRALAEACGVPVATSSLMQVPAVQATLAPGRRVGVLTISESSLGPDHLRMAGAPPDTPVGGTEAGRELTRAILGDELEIDVDLAREDVVESGRKLIGRHPEIGALVLECTNMPPYSADLAAALGIPVYDFYTFVSWFQSGLTPRRF